MRAEEECAIQLGRVTMDTTTQATTALADIILNGVVECHFHLNNNKKHACG